MTLVLHGVGDHKEESILRVAGDGFFSAQLNPTHHPVSEYFLEIPRIDDTPGITRGLEIPAEGGRHIVAALPWTDLRFRTAWVAKVIAILAGLLAGVFGTLGAVNLLDPIRNALGAGIWYYGVAGVGTWVVGWLFFRLCQNDLKLSDQWWIWARRVGATVLSIDVIAAFAGVPGASIILILALLSLHVVSLLLKCIGTTNRRAWKLGLGFLCFSIFVIMVVTALWLGNWASMTSKFMRSLGSGSDEWYERCILSTARYVAFQAAFAFLATAFLVPLAWLGLFCMDLVLDIAWYVGNEKRRHRLSRRLRKVVRYVCRFFPGARVTVVGHSLGSVIVTHAFTDPEFKMDAGDAVQVVTLGSPLNYLWRIFPRVIMSPTAIAEAFRRNGLVRNWLHLWRSGDPVGRALDLSHPLFAQKCIGLGGHSNYWKSTDTWVLPAIYARTGKSPNPGPVQGHPDGSEKANTMLVTVFVVAALLLGAAPFIARSIAG